MMDIDLRGVIDMHLHCAPDVEPRLADDIQTTRAAAAARMRAIVFKSHVTQTADRATIAERVVGNIRVFGGVTLNYPVGGLNPAAVEVALGLGAKEIWMPTKESAHERGYRGQSAPGLSILDERGQILPVVYEIVELIRDADVILGTGHLSIEETIELVRMARERGVRKVLVTHPEAYFVQMPVAIQHDLAALGAYFERCFVFTTQLAGTTITVADIAQQIQAVGVESTVLSTDLGQPQNPMPVDGMREYLAGLGAAGLSRRDLEMVSQETPAMLLDLPK
jgi:hypothetical protein